MKLGIFNSKLYFNKFPCESEGVGLCKYQVELDKFKRGLELGAAEVWLYQYDFNITIITCIYANYKSNNDNGDDDDDNNDDAECQNVLQ